MGVACWDGWGSRGGEQNFPLKAGWGGFAGAQPGSRGCPSLQSPGPRPHPTPVLSRALTVQGQYHSLERLWGFLFFFKTQGGFWPLEKKWLEQTPWKQSGGTEVMAEEGAEQDPVGLGGYLRHWGSGHDQGAGCDMSGSPGIRLEARDGEQTGQ